MPANYTGWVAARPDSYAMIEAAGRALGRIGGDEASPRAAWRWPRSTPPASPSCSPDLARLWAGLPRLAHWLAGAFPPDFSGLPDLLRRAAETVAIATLGTSLAALLALPLALMAARPVAPIPALYHPARALLDALRGVDGFVFALIFVAAVGLGPFAGMLGVALHSAGSIAKLWSEALETADPAPVEAALSAGARAPRPPPSCLLPETCRRPPPPCSTSGSSTSAPPPCSAWSAPAASGRS
jgi:hypothetical protein